MSDAAVAALSVGDRWRRWWVDAPTRVHLWCVERELRRVGASSPRLQVVRERNLDRLAAYRRSRRFPRNTYVPGRSPVFVDAGGRRCAVAELMHASGHGMQAVRLAEADNLARLGAIDAPELDAWAAESGLSRLELARIQPSYGGEVTFVPNAASQVVNVVMVVLIALGMVWLILDLCWRLVRHRPFFAPVGIALGAVLVATAATVLVYSARSMGVMVYYRHRSPREDLERVLFLPWQGSIGIVFGLGAICSVLGVWSWMKRARMVRETAFRARTDPST